MRSPENIFVAQFIGSPKMNLLDCTTNADTYTLPNGYSGTFTGSRAANRLGIRPEHISIGKSGEGHCDGLVDLIEFLGADTFVVFDCGDCGTLTVRVPGRSFP